MERRSLTLSLQQCDAAASFQAIPTWVKQLPGFVLLYFMEYSMVRLGEQSWLCTFPTSWPPPAFALWVESEKQRRP